MTDGDRAKLDQELQEKYAQTKADISRLTQLAHNHGESLENLGKTLQEMPENVYLRLDEVALCWKWILSPQAQGLREEHLPEWREVAEISMDLKRLKEELPKLERELVERRSR